MTLWRGMDVDLGDEDDVWPSANAKCQFCGKLTEVKSFENGYICFACYMEDDAEDTPWPGEDDPDPVDPTHEGWRP